jgi:hypothetical protein
VVGAYSYSDSYFVDFATSTATLGDISYSLFIGNKITAGSYGLYGGGVVGAESFSDSDYASATDTATVGAITGSLFIGNKITTGSYGLFGGGVVGADSGSYSASGSATGSATSNVGAITGSLFTGNIVTVSGGYGLYGGGVVGADSSTASYSENTDTINATTTVGKIENSLFTGNIVTVSSEYSGLYGGGVVGAESYSYSDTNADSATAIAIVGEITGSTFFGNTVTVSGSDGLQGGGVVGAYSYSGSSSATGSATTTATVGDITRSRFIGNTVSASTLYGGGVVGAYSDSATATLGDITGSLFSGNIVEAGSSLRGGGVVGVDANSTATLGAIENSLFTGNKVTVNDSDGLQGGGVVGAYSESDSATLGDISGSTFTGNTIKATAGTLWGGILYTGDDLIIKDSTFTDNTFTSGSTFFGTVSIDTSKLGTTKGDGVANIHTVTLEATNGKTIRFQNNIANGDAAYSIAFRNIQTPNASNASAVLNIVTQGTGTVALYDPIDVDLTDHDDDLPDNNQTFTMTASGSGSFFWGETNIVTVDAPSDDNKITLGSGSDTLTTTLQPGFTLTAPNHLVWVNSKATLNFMGTASLTVNALTIDGGTLNALPGSVSDINAENGLTIDSGGTLNLFQNSRVSVNNNLTINSDGTLNAYPGSAIDGNFDAKEADLNFHVPADYDTVSQPAVLTISGTADIDGEAGIDGSTVGVRFDGGSPSLRIGDKVVLIKARENSGDEGKQNLTPSNFNETIPSAGMAGVSLIYDLVFGNDDDELWVEIPDGGITVNPQTETLAVGQLSGLAFLTEVADLAERSLPFVAELTRLAPGPQAFGTVSGSAIRHKTGLHTDGAHLIAGLAVGAVLPQHQSALGVFFEHGEGNIRTDNDFANGRVKGRGDSEYQGLGFLGRVDFAGTAGGHPYLQATLRNGRVKTDFRAPDLKDLWGRHASFESKATYYGATLAMGYHWELGEQTGLDLYGKYFWTHENGDRARLSTGETVEFAAIDSRRVRFGTRYSHLNETKIVRSYVDLAWEHEFDGEAKAKINGYRINAPTLKGDSAIVELGVTFLPTPSSPLRLDFGLQGYAGKREGIMGSFRVNYRF